MKGLNTERFQRFSSFASLVRAVALPIHIAKCFKCSNNVNKCQGWHCCDLPCTPDELSQAKEVILAAVQKKAKNPVILPKDDHISVLLVRHHHAQVKHQDLHLTEGAVRAAGLWLLGGKSLINSILHKCVTCCKLRGKMQEQRMAGLPPEHLQTSPPCRLGCLRAMVCYHQTHQGRTSREQEMGYNILLFEFQSRPHRGYRFVGHFKLY